LSQISVAASDHCAAIAARPNFISESWRADKAGDACAVAIGQYPISNFTDNLFQQQAKMTSTAIV
jgi:hypothetical protein